MAAHQNGSQKRTRKGLRSSTASLSSMMSAVPAQNTEFLVKRVEAKIAEHCTVSGPSTKIDKKGLKCVVMSLDEFRRLIMVKVGESIKENSKIGFQRKEIQDEMKRNDMWMTRINKGIEKVLALKSIAESLQIKQLKTVKKVRNVGIQFESRNVK